VQIVINNFNSLSFNTIKFRKYSYLFIGVFVCFLLGSCASINKPLVNPIISSNNKADNELNKITQDIILGNLDSANQNINRLLVHQPENGQLHFLNGLNYHLQFAKGDPSKRDQAETGYLLALQFSPFDGKAARQLGYLYLELSRWRQAQARFSQSVKIDPTDVDSLLGLSIASYCAHDFGLALWASSEAIRVAPNSPKVLYMAAVIRAASGKFDEAKATLSLFKMMETDPQNSAKLSSALDRWNDVYKSNDYVLETMSTNTEKLQPVKSDDTTLSKAEVLNKSEAVVSPHWADCQQYLNPPVPAQINKHIANMDSDDDRNSSVLRTLNALPSPCKGLPLPRSVIFDAFILAMQEDNVENDGVNLLDGLSVVLEGSLTSSSESGTNTRVLKSSSISTPVGGLAYSLNMINSGKTRGELLSRPTLIALDRQPSYFFVGADLSVAIAGGNGGNGELVNIPIGTNLIVTPTFIDDNSMLIAVNIGRSAFQPISAGSSFSQQTQTSRSTAQANALMKFGETLIISGLDEKELSNFDSRVPVLGSLPGFNYFFGKSSNQKKHNSAVVMLTPRKPTTGNELPSLKDKEKLSLLEIRTKASKKGFVTSDNIETTLDLPDNRLYFESRYGVPYAEDWRQPSQLNKIFSSLKKALYFQ